MSFAYVKKICLFGGAGFVGSSIVRLLAKRGFELKIANITGLLVIIGSFVLTLFIYLLGKNFLV